MSPFIIIINCGYLIIIIWYKEVVGSIESKSETDEANLVVKSVGSESKADESIGSDLEIE